MHGEDIKGMGYYVWCILIFCTAPQLIYVMLMKLLEHMFTTMCIKVSQGKRGQKMWYTIVSFSRSPWQTINYIRVHHWVLYTLTWANDELR